MSDVSATPLRKDPGTYALVLRAERERRVEVGALGSMTVRLGVYVYVGSAFGPGGVRARVDRHAREGGALHWHVDYLRAATTLETVWYTHDADRRECLWARVLRDGSGASVPMVGFGASDCNCRAHLVRFDDAPRLARFREEVRGCDEDHAPIAQRVVGEEG